MITDQHVPSRSVVHSKITHSAASMLCFLASVLCQFAVISVVCSDLYFNISELHPVSSGHNLQPERSQAVEVEE